MIIAEDQEPLDPTCDPKKNYVAKPSCLDALMCLCVSEQVMLPEDSYLCLRFRKCCVCVHIVTQQRFGTLFWNAVTKLAIKINNDVIAVKSNLHILGQTESIK